MRNTLILLVLSSICRVPAEIHAIYLSVVEITESADNELNMTIKVFKDDLVDALRLANGDNLISTMDKLDEGEVNSYFNENIRFYPDPGADIGFIDYTIEGDSFFVNCKILRGTDSIEECSFSYLFELFPNQKNILKMVATDGTTYKTFSRDGQIEKIN